MRIAITCWNNRVSPLFDVAQKILVVDLSEGKIKSRRSIELKAGKTAYPGYRVENLIRLGINKLICGGITNFNLHLLAYNGIEVIPWIAGETEDVLEAFAEGRLNRKEFLMPGCRGRRHCFHGSNRKEVRLNAWF